MKYPLALTEWAVRHGVTPAALADLVATLHAPVAMRAGAADSEGAVQAEARIGYGKLGYKLYRNNVGVLPDKRDVPVRFGLANDSAKLNAHFKSSDLIGWRPVTILPTMVGSVIAQFASLEVKRPGWTYKGDAREQAQLNWINLVLADGGYASFVTGATR